jgi:uncharacterized membrane protein YgcG
MPSSEGVALHVHSCAPAGPVSSPRPHRFQFAAYCPPFAIVVHGRMIGVAGEWVWNPETHCEAERMTYYSVQVIEMEASWEYCEFRADGMEGGGGGGGGGRGMMAGVGGGSLPPWKRLLGQLRQNGWRSSSPLLVSSPGVEEGVFPQEFGQ